MYDGFTTEQTNYMLEKSGSLISPWSFFIVKSHFHWHSLISHWHYCDVIMGEGASQITSLTTVYSTVYSDADQRKHQSSASLAFVQGIHRGPVNSPHKWPGTRKMFPFDDVIMGLVLLDFPDYMDQAIINYAWSINSYSEYNVKKQTYIRKYRGHVHDIICNQWRATRQLYWHING